MSAGEPKLLTINSQDKDLSSVSNSDFTIECQEKYLLQSITRIVIVDAVVPNLFSNINVDNNRLDFREVAGLIDYQIFIPVGQYNISQLITVLTTEIDALITGSNVPTITLNPVTNKLEISMSLVGLEILPASTISEVIGQKPGQIVLPTGLITYLPRVINLSGLPIVYIHSKALSSGHGIDAGSGITNCVVAIPMANTPYGAYTQLLPKDLAVSEIVYDTPRNITSLDIRLRDSQGKILDIENLHMTLLVKLFF